MANLLTKRCRRDVNRLGDETIDKLLLELDDWKLGADRDHVQRKFHFKNYYETIAFVNAVAWVANVEDHHPDMHVGYSQCVVQYSTHSVGGLTENDFICAAKIDALMPSAV